MKRKLAIALSIIGWATLFIRIKMRIETEDVKVVESVIRFFSYFTILSNLLITIYFTIIGLGNKVSYSLFKKPGTLTALASIMTFVGIVYHILLSAHWNPTGMFWVTDQIHHTLIPLATIIFWFLYENKANFSFKAVLKWLLFPLVYILCILIRGYFSEFYPYYFLDVALIGLKQVLVNTVALILAFFILMGIYFFIAKKLTPKKV